jgi:hypothetical protein
MTASVDLGEKSLIGVEHGETADGCIPGVQNRGFSGKIIVKNFKGMHLTAQLHHMHKNCKNPL